MRTSLFTALSLVLLTGCGESLSAKAPKQAAPKSTDFFELTRETKGPLYRISLAYPQMICDGDSACEAMNQVIRSVFLEEYLEDTRPDGENHRRQRAMLHDLFKDPYSHYYKREDEYLDSEGELIERWKGVNLGGFGSFRSADHGYRCRYLSPELVSVVKNEWRDQANVYVSFHSANFWMRGERIEEIQLADLFEGEDWERRVEPIVVEHTLRAMGQSRRDSVEESTLSYIQQTWVERTFTFSAAGVHLHHDYSGTISSNPLLRREGFLDEVTLPLEELREHLDPDGPMARWL